MRKLKLKSPNTLAKEVEVEESAPKQDGGGFKLSLVQTEQLKSRKTADNSDILEVPSRPNPMSRNSSITKAKTPNSFREGDSDRRASST